MSQSLSVILPVHNAEHQLARKVTELLEVVAELTHTFELLIVDDGSTDNTEEVAMELIRQFPQVNILRLSEKVGDVAAARAGIAKTNGEMVLLHDVNSPLSGEAIRQFWEMRNDQELVFARSEAAHAPRSPRIAQREQSGWSGTQMLRRDAVNELQESSSSRMKIDRVMRTDLGAEATNPNSMLRQLTDAPIEQP